MHEHVRLNKKLDIMYEKIMHSHKQIYKESAEMNS